MSDINTEGFKKDSFKDKIVNLTHNMSFGRLKKMVESLIDVENQYGIYETPPQIIIDLSPSNRRNRDDIDVLMFDVWDSVSESIKYVEYNDLSKYIKQLHKNSGLFRCACLLPNTGHFGRMAITNIVTVRKNEDGVLPEQSVINESFAKHLNINIEDEDTEVSYVQVVDTPDCARYIVSAISGENFRKLMDSGILSDLMGKKVFTVRVMDRIIPLSNYIISHAGDIGDTQMCLCTEQRANDLTVWNLLKVNNFWIPTGVQCKQVPQVEVSDQLVTDIMLFENELIRIKNYPAPEKAVLVTNERPMLQDLFKMDELQNVFYTILGTNGLDSSIRDSALRVLKNDNAAIAGMLEMEQTITAAKDEIFRLYKGER